jgi:hypothetical protein
MSVLLSTNVRLSLLCTLTYTHTHTLYTHHTLIHYRYASKYIEMMAQVQYSTHCTHYILTVFLMPQLPLIAAESFVGLTQLFDFYMYTIFTVFVDRHSSELMFKPAPPYCSVAGESKGFERKYLRLEDVADLKVQY